MISQRSTSVRALVIISTTVAAFVLLLATAVNALSSGDPIRPSTIVCMPATPSGPSLPRSPNPGRTSGR